MSRVTQAFDLNKTLAHMQASLTDTRVVQVTGTSFGPFYKPDDLLFVKPVQPGLSDHVLVTRRAGLVLGEFVHRDRTGLFLRRLAGHKRMEHIPAKDVRKLDKVICTFRA